MKNKLINKMIIGTVGLTGLSGLGVLGVSVFKKPYSLSVSDTTFVNSPLEGVEYNDVLFPDYQKLNSDDLYNEIRIRDGLPVMTDKFVAKAVALILSEIELQYRGDLLELEYKKIGERILEIRVAINDGYQKYARGYMFNIN